MKYRPDIDGLRAIAVLAVVAFHIHAIPGGFVGVDIFFVISGYLISTIIVGEMQAGTFSLAKFYERRIKRILPALLVVCAACLLVSVFIFSPDNTVEMAKTALAASLSFSNIYFGTAGNYFGAYFTAPAATMPLLHTWSLGVEEQFYLTFPLLLMAIRKYLPRHLIAVVWLVFFASLALSTYGAFTFYDPAFYLPQDRAWELALGTLIALNAVRAPAGRLAREIVCLAGLAAMIASAFLVRFDVPLPGITYLPACAGTAAIILAGQGTLVGRALSLKPVVFIGLISYSLYLWHWPVFVFEQTNWLFYLGESRAIEKSVILVISFALAVLSWKFVEQPFRRGSWKPRRSAVFAGALAGILLIVGAAAATEFSGGFPAFNTAVRDNPGAYLSFDSKRVYRSGTCFPYRGENFDAAVKFCLPILPDRKNVLVMGDSHSQHLRPGLVSVLPGTNFLQAAIPGCKPLLQSLHDEYPACRALMTYMFKEFLPRHKAQLDLVVLAGDWHDENGDNLIATATALRKEGLPLLIVGLVPHYERQLPRLLFLEDHLKDPNLHNRYLQRDKFALDADLASRAAARHLPYMSPSKALCNASGCIARVHNVPVQWDFAHLTAEGSALVVRAMAPAIAAAER